MKTVKAIFGGAILGGVHFGLHYATQTLNITGNWSIWTITLVLAGGYGAYLYFMD